MVNSVREKNPGQSALIQLLTEHGKSFEAVANRFSRTRDDAEDALQRSYEIFLLNYDRIETTTAVAWLKTVIKHEALAVAKAGSKLVASERINLDIEEARHLPAVEEEALIKDEISRSQEALTLLKPHEREALMLQAEGFSYQQISQRRGWTYTKVNRCINEGRKSLLAKRKEIDCGQHCPDVDLLIQRHSQGDLERQQIKYLKAHLRHCGSCRSQFRNSKQQVAFGLGALPLFSLLKPAFSGPLAAIKTKIKLTINQLMDQLTKALNRLPFLSEQADSIKLAVVAASSVAVVSGGAVVATKQSERAVPEKSAQVATAQPQNSERPVAAKAAVPLPIKKPKKEPTRSKRKTKDRAEVKAEKREQVVTNSQAEQPPTVNQAAVIEPKPAAEAAGDIGLEPSISNPQAAEPAVSGGRP